MIGYDEPLYILPFDHRASFSMNLFGWGRAVGPDQAALISAAKQIVYRGFQAAVEAGVPAQRAGILVDEQFGRSILRDAAVAGFTTACSAEKGGQAEFDFEYGEEFAQHIEKCQPTFCKALVRYNTEGDQALNRRQAVRLKRLSDYLNDMSRSRFMLPLVAWRTRSIARNEAVAEVARRFHEFVDVFEAALPREIQAASSVAADSALHQRAGETCGRWSSSCSSE